MSKSRRALLAVIAGMGVLKVGSAYVESQSRDGSDTRDGSGAGSSSGDSVTASRDVLLHERQSVFLEPGEAFAERFESSGENTLRIEISNLPPVDGHLALYTDGEWERLDRAIRRRDDWDAGEPVATPSTSLSDPIVQDFPLTRHTMYALVFGLPANEELLATPDARNVQLEYWVLD